jgi:hypothetical protein
MAVACHEAPVTTTGRGPSSALDIGAIFRRHQDAYRRTHALGAIERRALRDICVCRTGALGGHRDECGGCGFERLVYNSCRNRHCPKCQALRQARWVAERTKRALPVRHFHVVFTLPAELRPLVREYQVDLLDLLFAAASETILELARDPKRLGATVGVTAVVHTWSRNLSFHPHLHCIVTGGGLTDAGDWINSREKYLLPVKVLGALFRGKFLAGLTRLFQQGKLLPGRRSSKEVFELLQAQRFALLKDALYAKPWNVYAKAPFRNSAALFRYLGLYTHRVAISNHRLLSADDREIAFRTRGDQICRLPPLEFMRRFLQHVLPRGFVKVRHFGLLAAGNVNTKLAAAHACFQEPGSAKATKTSAPATDWRTLLQQLTGIDPTICRHCGGRFLIEPLLEICSPARPPPPDSS